MLWRKNEAEISSWIKTGKEALLVTGARQTGKTYLIEHTLKKEKCNFVELNLIKQKSVIDALKAAENENYELFVSRLSLFADKPLKKNSTIIFIDEIQEYKEILTAIKFLVLEGSFRYILSGSLLGVELVGIKSAPVGYLATVNMFPLDFEEFVMALNLSHDVLDNLEFCFTNKIPVDEFVHKRLMDAFFLYMVVGGMPAAVQSYINNNNFEMVSSIHKNITEQYKVDFTKYEINQKLKLIETYNLIPAELNASNKRYIYTDLNKNLRFERYQSSFSWLVSAGVAIPVYNITQPKIPLEINKKSNLFKLFLSDVGMLSTAYGNAAKLNLLNHGKDMNCGALYENFVAQELSAHGFDGFYFSSKKLGELDFVIEYNGVCLPIEVKSGKDYQVHSALKNVLNVTQYLISSACVFTNDNILVNDRITYYPIYMTMFLKQKKMETNIPHLDLSDL